MGPGLERDEARDATRPAALFLLADVALSVVMLGLDPRLSPRKGLKYRGKINHECEDADARVEPEGVFDAKMRTPARPDAGGA
jgi:hypothetical protein